MSDFLYVKMISGNAITLSVGNFLSDIVYMTMVKIHVYSHVSLDEVLYEQYHVHMDGGHGST